MNDNGGGMPDWASRSNRKRVCLLLSVAFQAEYGRPFGPGAESTAHARNLFMSSFEGVGGVFAPKSPTIVLRKLGRTPKYGESKSNNIQAIINRPCIINKPDIMICAVDCTRRVI